MRMDGAAQKDRLKKRRRRPSGAPLATDAPPVDGLGLVLPSEPLRASPRRGDTRAHFGIQVFACVFEHSPTGAVLLSPRGKILRANPALGRLLGFEPEELVGRHLAEFVHTRDGAHDDDIFKRLRLGEILSHSMERRLLHRTGRPRSVALDIEMIQDRHGKPWVMSVHVRDISTRKAQRTVIRRLTGLLEASEDAIVGASPDGLVTSWNRGAEDLFGYVALEMIGQPISKLIPPDRSDEGSWLLGRLQEGHKVRGIETVRLHKSGRLIEVAVSWSALYDEDGKVVELCHVSRDITVQHRLQRQARQLQSYFAGVLSHIDSGVLLTNAEGRVVYANESFAQISMKPAEQVIGRRRLDLFGELATRAAEPSRIDEAARRPATDTFTLELSVEDPEQRAYRWQHRPISLPASGERLDVFHDVTDEVRLRKILAHSATTDPLTGLLNRRGALQVLDREVAQARRHDTHLSVAMIDIDRFKELNDSSGHEAGDVALRSVSAALARSLRSGDSLARWGGEELLAILPHTSLDQAHAMAERLREAIAGLDIEGLPAITVSVGVAERAPSEETADAAIARADVRLYHAKREGRNRVA